MFEPFRTCHSNLVSLCDRRPRRPERTSSPQLGPAKAPSATTFGKLGASNSQPVGKQEHSCDPDDWQIVPAVPSSLFAICFLFDADALRPADSQAVDFWRIVTECAKS